MQRPDALRRNASSAFRQKEAQARDRSTPAGLASALQPQKRERQTILDGVRGLAVGNAQHGPLC